MSKLALSSSDAVVETLTGYAERGVFQAFSRPTVADGKMAFRFVWHRGRTFEFIFDSKRRTLRLTELLAQVPTAMYKDLKAFIQARQSDELPEHRRIDRERVQIRSACRAGSVSIVMAAQDGDLSYMATRLVHLMNEVYLTFLGEGKYFDYLVEAFDLDPDHM